MNSPQNLIGYNRRIAPSAEDERMRDARTISREGERPDQFQRLAESLFKEQEHMSYLAEIERLERGGIGLELPAAKWIFTLSLGGDPSETWRHFLGAVKSIVEQDATNWPNDEYWRRALPTWLSCFMMTAEECDAAMARTPREQWIQLPWEFGSWLDAMRERDWRWWGGERSGNEAHIVLEIKGIPPRIDAFKQILLAAGAQITSEEHD